LEIIPRLKGRQSKSLVGIQKVPKKGKEAKKRIRGEGCGSKKSSRVSSLSLG
jgi:hypothetical protein